MEGMELTLEADEPDSMAHTPWLGLRPACRLCGGCLQRQVTPRAAPRFGQSRPVSR